MKKIAGIILLIAGAVSSITGAITLLNIRSNVPSNISIIGGADGPTAIFLAGKLGFWIYGPIIAGVVLVVLGIILIIYGNDIK